jgi:2,5-furandicarboxylate decarboxylase 1
MTSINPFAYRDFLAHLKQTGDLIEISERIDLNCEVGALCRTLSDRSGPAALLTDIGSNGRARSMAVNVYGERRRVARAFRVPEADLLSFVSERMSKRIEPEVSLEPAPCQEVVLTGNEIDLTEWPIPFWNAGDGGPYITAGLHIVKHPEFGWNMSYNRAQVYGPRELGVCMAPDHHLQLTTEEARQTGSRVEAAIIIGVRPSIAISAASDLAHGDYELRAAGALEGQPIRTVRCKTVDVEVPSDTEIVIEGYYGGEVRDEGPFVEFTGYQTPIVRSPVFTVTAITHRRDPIYQGVFAGRPPCETNTLWRELEEAEAFTSLRRKFPMLKAVHRPPQIGRDFLGIVQIDPTRQRDGMVNTLLLATAAVMPRLKFVIAIDDDIDIYDLTSVLWAVSTRCDPRVDVQSVSGTMTSWLDPSSGGLTGKLFLNATKKPGFRGEIPIFPPAAIARVTSILDRLDQNSKSASVSE